MNIKKRYSHSFSARLSLYIAVVVAGIFTITSIVYYQSAKGVIEDEAVDRAQGLMNNTILEIDKMLYSVEVAVANMAWTAQENLNDPEYMYSIPQRLLRNNPFIYGSAVAFDAYYFNDLGLYFSPYSFRNGEEIDTKQLGTEDYDYHHMEWYQIPYLMRKPYWNEPYFDEGGGEEMMITYSYPLFDSHGDLFGILTADISLEWLTEQVKAIQPYPNSYNFMIGRGGTYLVHSKSDRVLNETVFTTSYEMQDANLERIARDMISGNTSHSTFDNEGVLSCIFYSPIKRIGWSIAVVSPYEEVFAKIIHMRTLLWIVAIVGLIIMILLCYSTIKRTASPLKNFARSAHEIAKGNFAAELPQIKSRDEMRMLHDSFAYMQRSLVEYIDELKSTTANRERIESELRIASNIQMGMVPKTFPPFHNLKEITMYATLHSAKEVGGDLYDFFVDKDRFYFIIGDVSGKGVPASLIMAVTCRLFRSIASFSTSPADIVKTLNNSLSEANEANMFVTFFIGVLDIKTGKMKYCNAGHNAPIFIDPNGNAAYMKTNTNIPLGLFENFEYEEAETDFPAGSSIYLYTDGVTEAENINKKQYSDERLLNIFKDTSLKNNPEKLINTIVEDVKTHAGDAEQSDDITMLSIFYNPE